MKRYIAAWFACVLLGVRVAPTVAEDTTMLSVSTPATLWELQFPRAHWTLQQTQKRADGLSYYYLFANPSTQLTMSFFIEPATQCKSSSDCRSLFWSNPGPLFQNPRAVEQFEDNGFAIVKFIIPNVGGLPAHQLNYSAHIVRDGYWVDMHVSQIFTGSTNEEAVSNFIKSVSFQNKVR